jgi:nocturnin
MININMLKRRWLNIMSPQDNTISVLSWNTLADALAHNTFTNIQDPSILSWESRKTQQLNVILEHNYDIICLQEVDHYHDYLHPELVKHGYIGTFQPKYNDIGDGICIFWKKDKYDIIDDMKFRYIKCSQVGVIVVIQSVTDHSKKLCIATTHLKSKPEFADIRKTQTAVFIDNVQHMVDKYNCPTIIGGDMNDEPQSDIIKLFKSKYTSAYNNDNCPWTTWKQRNIINKRCIDYVLYDPFWLKLTNILTIPDDKECPNMLPASYYPSDHMAIACKFKMVSM